MPRGGADAGERRRQNRILFREQGPTAPRRGQILRGQGGARATCSIPKLIALTQFGAGTLASSHRFLLLRRQRLPSTWAAPFHLFGLRLPAGHSSIRPRFWPTGFDSRLFSAVTLKGLVSLTPQRQSLAIPQFDFHRLMDNAEIQKPGIREPPLVIRHNREGT